MSTTRTTDPRHALALQQAIKKQLDTLLCHATATALLLKDSPMEKNQLRNLLNVASDSGSFEVVANFIRYQIARKGNDWGTSSDSFGHSVIRELNTSVSVLADKVVKDVTERVGAETAHQLRAEAYEQLMTLYLGYLNRAFYFYKSTQDQARQASPADKVKRDAELKHAREVLQQVANKCTGGQS